jgi:hypothetical protein
VTGMSTISIITEKVMESLTSSNEEKYAITSIYSTYGSNPYLVHIFTIYTTYRDTVARSDGEIWHKFLPYKYYPIFVLFSIPTVALTVVAP